MGTGIVIGPAKIGSNVTIYHHVTIGGNYKLGECFPTIESNVILSAGAVVAGPISVGPDTLVGANVVLTKTLPGNSVIAGVHPK